MIHLNHTQLQVAGLLLTTLHSIYTPPVALDSRRSYHRPIWGLFSGPYWVFTLLSQHSPDLIPQLFCVGMPDDVMNIHPRTRFGGMALPSFHTLGIYYQLLYTIYGIILVTVFPPKVLSPGDLPFLATSDNILEHLERTKSNCFTIVPTFLHVWAQSEAALMFLKSMAWIVNHLSRSDYSVHLTSSDYRPFLVAPLLKNMHRL